MLRRNFIKLSIIAIGLVVTEVTGSPIAPVRKRSDFKITYTETDHSDVFDFLKKWEFNSKHQPHTHASTTLYSNSNKSVLSDITIKNTIESLSNVGKINGYEIKVKIPNVLRNNCV